MNDYTDRNLEEYLSLLDDSKEHLSNQAIATYQNLTELLSAKEKSFIERHIEDCNECKSKFATIQAENLEMDNISEERVILKERKKITNIFSLRSVVKYSVAAAIVFGILFIADYIFLNEKTVNKKSPIAHNLDSLKNSKDSISSLHIVENENNRTDEIAVDGENFAENNILENFISRNIRSEKTVEIISPKIGAEVGTKIKFEWERIAPIGQPKLTIVDNKNLQVYEITVAGNTLTIDKKFKPGLYYWKLTSDDKLEAVGKFYVKRQPPKSP